jgi:hypothetical protein
VFLGPRLGDTARDLAGQPDRTKGNSSRLQFGQFGQYVREARSGAAIYEIGSSVLGRSGRPTVLVEEDPLTPLPHGPD